MTNMKCKYLKANLYCMIGKVKNESLSYASCPNCPSFKEVKIEAVEEKTSFKCIAKCEGGCVITNNSDDGWTKEKLDGQLCKCSKWVKIEDDNHDKHKV